ncbi:hypothetical protein C5688_01290 [Methylocystis sp. MitZ-2018]|nr:hypothetical protein C5688_01290 [Methylocystis sp. MitZ-2018]
MAEQLVFLRVPSREVVARPPRVEAASLGANSGSRMSQRENPHDNDGTSRDAEPNLNNKTGGPEEADADGFQDVDGAQSDGVSLDPKVQAQLGRVFRAYCDDLIHQPIPDKFTVLLAKLEAKQREKK